METTAQKTEPIVVERQINATPAQIYPYLIEAEQLKKWLAIEAETDPRPGGVMLQTHSGPAGDSGGPYFMIGEFVELRQDEFVSYTWGWKDSEMGNGPGTSNVEFELLPRDGGTLLRLTHSNLAVEGGHRDGWTKLIDELASLFD